ncbi:TadE/TadG family type IV pilus assembly protein [Aquabacterium sp.]|uniref:TadE/TadG family type IV pilus assembly protein n=1 Tax=Aquabacterium sp. TaxID=1872578 RepID=UPI004037F731
MTPLARRARQAGAVAIELALVSILLATMMFGALDLGRAMYAYNEIVQSTRSAARYLATSTTIGSTEITRARNLVVYGKFSSSGPALSNELTSSNTHIQFCSTTYCDITGKTTADMNNQAVSGATSVNLVMVQVSNLTLVTYFPQVVANMLFRPITVTFPRVS